MELTDKLYNDVKEYLGRAGLVVIIHHRLRMGVDIRAFWDDKSQALGLREVDETHVRNFVTGTDLQENLIHRSICDLIGYEPQVRKVYQIDSIEQLSAVLCVFAKLDLGTLGEFIESNLDLCLARIENLMQHEALIRNHLELELLQGTGELLSTSLKLEDAFNSIVDALDRLISFRALGIFIVSDNGETIEEVFSVGYEKAVDRELLNMKSGKGLVGWVIKTGEPVIVPDVGDDPRYVAARNDTCSELVVPLFSGDKVLGAFNIESNRQGAYTPYHLQMVSAFANQAAVSITHAKLFEEAVAMHKIEDELRIARDIQKTFLPARFPQYEGFDLDAINIPSAEVGGDYFDFISIVEYQIGIAIGDVSGHGIPASLIMAAFRASLIAEIRNNYAIRTIFHKVNNLICESVGRGNFVTAVYGVLDTRNRIFTFTNAGHVPPFILRADGKVDFLYEGGLTLGIIPEKEYCERPLYIGSGEILVLYTDGITEAENEDGGQFGTGRLVELVKENSSRSAREIREIIVSAVFEFKAKDFRLDDLTLLLIKVD